MVLTKELSWFRTRGSVAAAASSEAPAVPRRLCPRCVQGPRECHGCFDVGTVDLPNRVTISTLTAMAVPSFHIRMVHVLAYLLAGVRRTSCLLPSQVHREMVELRYVCDELALLLSAAQHHRNARR